MIGGSKFPIAAAYYFYQSFGIDSLTGLFSSRL